MKRTLIFITMLVLTINYSCSDLTLNNLNSNDNQREITPLEKEFLGASDIFGLKLFRKINKEEPAKNIFISPISVSVAFGMTLNGAHGSTYDAIRKTLELSSANQEEINKSYKSLSDYLVDCDSKVTVKIANSIWYRNDLHVKPAFTEINIKFYNAAVSALDFNSPGAPGIINNWVKENTNYLIEKIIDEIPADRVMYLINAIYFKGDWLYQFDKSLTSDEKFFLQDGTWVTTKMMKQKLTCKYFEDESLQAVRLMYGNGRFGMTIYMPKRNDINTFISGFTEEKHNSILNSFTEKEVNLWLPKIKMEYSMLLNDVLKSLGMDIAFGSMADFSGISDEKIFISEVRHKTFVDVNEEGTEAAGVTSIGFDRTSVGDEIYMLVNKPFVFEITEETTNSILFIGKNINPELK